MTEKEYKTLDAIITRIEKRLGEVEDLLSWTTKASQLFFVGQRVEFNSRADRAGITKRTKGKVRKGRVVEIPNDQSIHVLLDGYKQPKSYHHSFFK